MCAFICISVYSRLPLCASSLTKLRTFSPIASHFLNPYFIFSPTTLRLCPSSLATFSSSAPHIHFDHSPPPCTPHFPYCISHFLQSCFVFSLFTIHNHSHAPCTHSLQSHLKHAPATPHVLCNCTLHTLTPVCHIYSYHTSHSLLPHRTFSPTTSHIFSNRTSSSFPAHLKFFFTLIFIPRTAEFASMINLAWAWYYNTNSGTIHHMTHIESTLLQLDAHASLLASVYMQELSTITPLLC